LFEARKLDIVVLLVFGGMTIEYRTSWLQTGVRYVLLSCETWLLVLLGSIPYMVSFANLWGERLHDDQ
jgi:hypothetical protein